MGIRVKVDLSGAEKRLTKGADKARYVLANQVLADSNKYVPKLSGDLQRFSQVTNENKSIIWTQPYARRHYYNQFVNYTTPGTGPKWDEKAKRNHLSSWVNITEGAFK